MVKLNFANFSLTLLIKVLVIKEACIQENFCEGLYFPNNRITEIGYDDR